MLELFAPFEHRRRQLHEPFKRRPAVGIEPDVVIERSLSRRSGRAGEVEGTEAIAADRRPNHLDHVGIGAFVLVGDLGGDGGNIHRRIGEQGDGGANRPGFYGGQIALQIDDDPRRSTGIDLAERLEDAVGSGSMVGSGQHCARATGLHGGSDFGRVGRNPDGPYSRLHGPRHDVGNHRLSANVGEGFAGQAGRRHACRNEHDGIRGDQFGAGHGKSRRGGNR